MAKSTISSQSLDRFDRDINLTSITSMMNSQHINSKLDLEDIEREIMGQKKVILRKNSFEGDPVSQYIREVNNITDDEHDEHDVEKSIHEREDIGSIFFPDKEDGFTSVSRRHRSLEKPKLEHHHQEDDKMWSQQFIKSIEKRSNKQVEEIDEAIEEQDQKDSLYEHIMILSQTLKDDGIDCSEIIKKINKDSPVEKLSSTYKLLKLKSDRKRYSVLFEEVVVYGSELLERYFDGTKKIPIIGSRPNYTGIHNRIQTKLRRMRPETSGIVSRFIGGMKLPSLAKVALEILPSILIYPSQNKAYMNQPGLNKSADFSDKAKLALEKLRDSENFEKIDSI